MTFNNMFPRARQNKVKENLVYAMYLAMCEWGWSYEQFLDTPFIVTMELVKKYTEIKKKEAKRKK